MVASNSARRVYLTHLPIRVLPRLVLAVQRQVGTALGPEATSLLRARPRLVDHDLVERARKGEGGLRAGQGLGAVVDKIAVKKVVELVGDALTLCLGFESLILKCEVDVAPGVLVGGRSENVRGVEVEVLDFPFLGMHRLLSAGIMCGRGSHGSSGQEQG